MWKEIPKMKNKLFLKITVNLLMVLASVVTASERLTIKVQLYVQERKHVFAIGNNKNQENIQLCQNFGLRYDQHSMLLKVCAMIKGGDKVMVNWADSCPDLLQRKIRRKSILPITTDLAECKHPHYLPEELFINKRIGDVIELKAYGCKVKATICEFPSQSEHAIFTFIRICNAISTIGKPLLLCCAGGIILYFLCILKK